MYDINVFKERIKKEGEDRKIIEKENLPEIIAQRIINNIVTGTPSEKNLEYKINYALNNLQKKVELDKERGVKLFEEEVIFFINNEKINDKVEKIIIFKIEEEIKKIIPMELYKLLKIEIDIKKESINTDDDPLDMDWGNINNKSTITYLSIFIKFNLNN